MDGGTRVTIKGVGFEGVYAVRFGSLWGADLAVPDDGTLEVTTPPGVPGLVDVIMVRSDGVTVKRPGGFEYLADGPLVALIGPVYGAQAGGTMVTVIGAGFHAGCAVRFGGIDADEVIFHSPTELWAWTPQGSVGTVDVTVGTLQGDAVLPEAYSYFDPGAYWGGGTWGDPIDGAVNVTILDSYTMDALPDAYVIIGDSATSPWQGWTDDRGQITFSGPGFFGPVSMHATKVHHDAASVVDFDAENVTVYLVPEDPPPTDGPTDPPPDPPPPGRVKGKVLGLSKYVVVPPGSCLHQDWVPGGPCAPCVDDGDCLDGDCREIGGQGSFCTNPCLDADDCPEGFLCAGGVASTWSWCVPPAGARAVNCEVSGTSIYTGWNMDDGPNWLNPTDPKFDFEGTRLGEVAVVCFGGYVEAGSGEFVPLAMGVRRHVMVAPGETIEDQNIYLGIPLSRELRLRMDHPPIFEPGGGYYRVRAYLDFGSDGIADLRQGLDSYLPEDIRFEHLPEELAGDIYDAEYIFIAGAYSNTTEETPYSVVLYYGISALDAAAAWIRDGALWSESPGAPVDPLLALCDTADGMIAVGQDGMAARLGEAGWGSQPKLVNLDLRACATGPNGDLVVVGDGGAVLLREGGQWRLEGTVTDRDLRAVAWTDAGVIVGAGPQRAVRFDEDGWHETKLTFDLRGAASGGAVAWVVGTQGTILRSEGLNWILEPAPDDRDLLAAAGLGDGHVVAMGDGVVLLRTPVGWTDLGAPDDLRYVAADGPAPNDFWLVAEGGALVHRINDDWEVVRPSEALEFTDVVAEAGAVIAVGAPALLFSPFQHFPVFARPTEDGPWKSLRLTWNNGSGPVPKFHTLSLAEATGRTFWRLTVNGPARDVRLPDFDAASGWDPVKPGPKQLRVYSIHKDDFDIDGFDWSDLSTYRWRAWAYDRILFD
ncbi:MAG: IPT/TIG domain-containing protein [Pseudomonadota bacterium]